ncbi:acylphosphatase [Xanthomonas sp. Leaf131]|nr:acylphosphatase [Xanthomonas sp. Leaf131]
MQAARFVVTGAVQGVWFRASTRERAIALGLRGHARNQADGSVEVVAAGTAAAVDALETWLWQGPPAAKVAAVTRAPCAPPPTEECVTG